LTLGNEDIKKISNELTPLVGAYRRSRYQGPMEFCLLLFHRGRIKEYSTGVVIYGQNEAQMYKIIAVPDHRSRIIYGKENSLMNL